MNEMEYTITKVSQYDKARLEDINKESKDSLRKIYRPKENAKFEPLNPLKEELIIVKKDEKEIGTLHLHHYEDRLHILGLGVLHSFRGKGVCRTMIDFVKLEAEKMNKKKISLYTIRETGNVEIFNRFGFVVLKEEIADDFVSDSYDILHEVFMTCDVHKLNH
jgi:N-acetylglutamate synthase-like GNAT family acetyltransferase